jgi:hydroxypyruvate isomerase
MERRALIKNIGLSAATIIAGGGLAQALNNKDLEMPWKGNIKHSLASWTYNFLGLEGTCQMLQKMGIGAIDLIAPKDFDLVKKYKLYVSMCYTAGNTSLTEGWNQPKNHDALINDYTAAIPIIAAAGFKNLICFSGNRNGMNDNEGLNNCLKGLQQILPLAEKMVLLYKWNYLIVK